MGTTTLLSVPTAVINVTLDPVLRLTETSSVRFETIGLAIVLFLGLVLAARIGSITPAVGPYVPAPGLRIDDLVFIVVGSVPGAIVGGRLGYVLDHLDYYRANPAAILDPGQGGLTLTLAVPLGILTGGLIARLLGAPVGRWLHALALPLLFVLAAGKLVGVLGATGQGAPSDLPWATTYEGPGPWGSLGVAIPSHPAQVYEAVLVGGAIVALAVVSRVEFIARRDGAAMFAALALWAVARFMVASTWRDPIVAGPLRMEQLLDIGVLLIAMLGLRERARAPLVAPSDKRLDAEARLA
jgi:phosphatidylglycerol:prolipoprotein diacylglycerol transferase